MLLVGDQGQLSAVDAGGMFAALVRDRDGLAPELSDVRRFHHDWEKAASVELRAGSDDAIDAYEAHGRIVSGDRDEMLDALYAAWKHDTEAGTHEPDDRRRSGHRQRAQRPGPGRPGRRRAGDRRGRRRSPAAGRPGSVTRCVTRQNNRRLDTGRRWVRNGDQLDRHGHHRRRIHDRASGRMAPERWSCRPTTCAEHVELAYASTAHRAQGRTVDTAHAMVSPTTTREVLYVSATRGREANRLYVDTHYDPDPQTSHDEATEPVTAREVLAGVLRNEGADVAAHEMIRREQHEAEGMERLSAEYLTLATLPKQSAGTPCSVRSGLTETDLDAVRASEAHGPLLAAFREAEARGLDVEAAFPQLVAGRSLADAADVAAVLHGRVDRWTQAAGGRRRWHRQPHRRADPEGTRCHRSRDGPRPWPSGTRPWNNGPARWPTKRSRPEPLGAAPRARSERSGPPGALAARSLDGRGLPGPLAHHRTRRPSAVGTTWRAPNR